MTEFAFERSEDPLAGLNLLDAIAYGVARRTDELDEQAIDRTSTVHLIQGLQDRAWETYRTETLEPRWMAWESVAQHLRATPPQTRESSNHAAWEFVARRNANTKAGNSTIEVCTSISLSCALSLDPAAESYLRRPIIGKECPEEILGVPVEGKRGKRQIPEEPLRRKLDGLLIDNASFITASVKAAVLGSPQEPKLLYWVRMPFHHDTEERNWGMQPENAHHFLDSYTGDDAAMIARIREHAARPETDQEYAKLSDIGNVLLESVPANKA